MTSDCIGISTATITFFERLFKLPNEPKWILTIKFENCPMFIEHNRLRIPLNTSYPASLRSADMIRRHFALNHMFEGSKVTVIYDQDNILAMSANGMDKYIDCNDDFKVKQFSELGLNITSLIVVN